ncbi:hypothetical protein ABFS83_11G087000 [Erythranthe nasuta]
MYDWMNLETRLRSNKTIDHSIQENIKTEKEHWKQVLKIIIAVVKTLAKNNLAFRGTNEKNYDNNNEIFLGLIELITEFDPIMQLEHLRLIKDREIHIHYLGHNIQNELVHMLACELKINIIKRINILKIDDTTGKCIFDKLLNVIKNLALDIDNVRGQGYDNGSNMTGKE